MYGNGIPFFFFILKTLLYDYSRKACVLCHLWTNVKDILVVRRIYQEFISQSVERLQSLVQARRLFCFIFNIFYHS